MFEEQLHSLRCLVEIVDIPLRIGIAGGICSIDKTKQVVSDPGLRSNTTLS